MKQGRRLEIGTGMLYAMGRDEMRVGDSERQAAADKLKTALDEGRLDLHEYDERLQKTYVAKTYGELDGLLTDLPGTTPAQRSRVEPYQPAAEPMRAGDPGVSKPGGPPFLASYGGVVVLCIVIWAISSLASGDFLYFWPGWMFIPLIFGLIGRISRRDR